MLTGGPKQYLAGACEISTELKVTVSRDVTFPVKSCTKMEIF